MQDGPRIKEKKMTGFDMPEWARRAALARHGCEHPFGALDPARTALVVIDMQNGFMVREGAASFLQASLTIPPGLNRPAPPLRAAGGPGVWVQTPPIAYRTRAG